MDIIDNKYEINADIKTESEDVQEISVIDVAQFMEPRSIVSTTKQPNNAAIFKSNTLPRSRKKRKKKMKALSNFAINFPSPSTAAQTLSNFAFNFPTSSTASQAPELSIVSASVGVKHPQSSNDSSVSNSDITCNSSKKLKIFDNRVQAINNNQYYLTRAIVSTNNMSLGLEHLTLLRGAISKEIDKIVDGSSPKFHDSYIKFGAVVVKCVDEASLHWLSMQIANISPWPEAKLKMISFNELQIYFRACVWIPGPLEATKTILMRLARQNPNLNTASWQIFAENLGASEDGRSLFLGVPESDFKKLETSNFMAYLGLGQVNFVFSNINQEELIAAIS